MHNTPFNPVSADGAGIAHLFTIGLVMCYCILALVTGLVAYACFKFRARPGRVPRQVFGHTWAERSWTVLPLLLLASMFGLTIVTVDDTDPPPPRNNPDLIVIGHQWWWEFRYPHSGAVTAYELHLPVNRRFVTRIQAADVIHDFSVMQLGRKMDAIPGYWNYMWLGADRIGTYPGFCNEFCGAEHAWMQFKVVVQNSSDYTAWLKQEAAPAATPVTDQEKRGLQLFQQKSCSNCHTIRGTNAKADIGPDLTHIGSRSAIGSGVLRNTTHNLLLWLKNPQDIKPGVHMPNMQLNDPDAQALVAYLESLK
jgi:cytochrome c oxidase subunit 2